MLKNGRSISTVIESDDWLELVKISHRDDRPISNIIRGLLKKYLESEKND